MKTVKIVLGIISAITIIFFATGLVIKETNYMAQVSINKPVDEVFLAFNKKENIKNWIPEVKSVEIIQENLGKTGSTYKVVLDNNGEKIVMTEKVMAYVPNEKVTLFFDAENMLKTDDYTFIEKNGKTTIQLNASCQSDSYIIACLFPYFKGTFKNQNQSYLNNFKTFIETP
jgi:uncharacterized membrane protein